MTTETELLRCPFCGSKGMLFDRNGVLYGTCISDDCEAETSGSADRNEAAAAWNRRSPPSGAEQGEAVAWRIRERPGFDWRFTDDDPARMPNIRDFEVQPLYLRPAQSQEGELREILRSIINCTARPNPTDQSRIDVATGQHKKFGAAIEQALAAFTSPQEGGGE